MIFIGWQGGGFSILFVFYDCGVPVSGVGMFYFFYLRFTFPQTSNMVITFYALSRQRAPFYFVSRNKVDKMLFATLRSACRSSCRETLNSARKKASGLRTAASLIRHPERAPLGWRKGILPFFVTAVTSGLLDRHSLKIPLLPPHQRRPQ